MIRKEGVDAQTSVMFYTTVVQAVIIYGSELWVLSPQIGKTLGGFYHWVIRRLMRRMSH